MSFISNVVSVLRIDKLFNLAKHMITGDILTIGSYYMAIIFNLLMIAGVIYVFNWIKYVLG